MLCFLSCPDGTLSFSSSALILLLAREGFGWFPSSPALCRLKEMFFGRRLRIPASVGDEGHLSYVLIGSC